jgi:hypothetical protein
MAVDTEKGESGGSSPDLPRRLLDSLGRGISDLVKGRHAGAFSSLAALSFWAIVHEDYLG